MSSQVEGSWSLLSRQPEALAASDQKIEPERIGQHFGSRLLDLKSREEHGHSALKLGAGSGLSQAWAECEHC